MINIEDYMPLVNKITHKRYEQFKYKYDYEDLFQAGCLGLITAAKKFDESKGTKFLSYAYAWVDGYICNYIRNDRWCLGKNKEERFTAPAPISLDKFINEEKNRTYLDQIAGSKDVFQLTELKILLDKLPDILKKIIQLKYFNDFTQTKISKILGINQVRVSRYERKALGILRKEMMF